MTTSTTTIDAGARMSLRRRILHAACVAAVAIAAASLIAEVLCRTIIPIPDNYELIDDPILFYRLAADVDVIEDGVRYTHTQQHARGPLDFAEEKPPGAHRVAWVGDSACFGIGVADEETAPNQLQMMARGHGVDLESINLAVPGYNVAQVREVVAQRCTKLRDVDTIVYYHHRNDIINAPWAELAPFVPSDLYWKYERPGNWLIRCLKRSALVRRLGHTRLAAKILRWSPRDTGATAPTTGAVRPPTANSFDGQCDSLYVDGGRHGVQFRDDLYAMAAEAKRQGAVFIMVYFPVKSSLKNSLDNRVAGALAARCAEGGIGFIDLSEAFASAREADLYADSIHPGKSGQHIVASAVWEYLVASGVR